MSESRQVQIATPTKGLCQVLGSAVAATTGLCLTVGLGTINGCKEVYRRCKEEGYPVENLLMAHTPIHNFDGFTTLLKNNGFTLKPLETHNISVAVNPLTSESLFLVNSSDGIGLISEDKDLIQSSLQSFAAQEVTFALQGMGFKVDIEGKGQDKVITAYDTQKNCVNIKIDKGELKANIDTRRSKRPKCDFIHQLLSQRLKEPDKKRTTEPQRRKRRNDIHIHT